MKISKFELKNLKKDKRALIVLGVSLFLFLSIYLGECENSKTTPQQEKESVNYNTTEDPFDINGQNEEDYSKDVLSGYVDAFLASNPDITYQEALDALLQNTEMPTHIITPSRVKPLLQAKMRTADNPVLIYSISGNKSLKIVKGNIFLADKDNKEKQITFEGLDTEAIFSPDEEKIAFLRENPERTICYGDGCVRWNELWLHDLATEGETILLRGYDEKDIARVSNLHNLVFLPNDNENIYFMRQGWVTSDAIDRLDISTKEVKFIIDGNAMEAINEGEYKGNLLVLMHRYPHFAVSVYGAYDRYFIISPEGEEILAMGYKDDLYNDNLFRTSQKQRDDFMKDVEKFFNVEFPESNIEGVKRVVEREKRGENIFHNLSYPEFDGKETVLLPWDLDRIVGHFSKSIVYDNFFDGSLIYNDYEITLLTDSVVSIKFNFYMRRADESQGTYKTKTANFEPCIDCRDDEYLGYKDIFKSGIDYLSILSEIAEEKLINIYKTNGEEYNEDLMKEITMPDSGNLETFNLSKNALIITFDADKTGNSLDEKQTIEIPYAEIKKYIDPDGSIGYLIYK